MSSNASVEPARPPQTRGEASPFSWSVFVAGIVALTIVAGGLALVQTVYHAGDHALSPTCSERLTIQLPDEEPKLGRGAKGVCHSIDGLQSGLQTSLLFAGIALGALCAAAGFASYRKMPTRRMREHCISGAVLGVHAITLAAAIFWFRSGDLIVFGRNFLNFDFLDGSVPGFIRGAKNTLVLAFAGELGGIVIGLILAMLTLSERRVVRAPARGYINFFRGTPLIWQLSFFFFLLLLGLDLKVSAFQTAVLVFCLNTGAYAAEVFRAGIQSVEKGQREASRSLGMSYLQSMGYVIVPQAVRRVIPPLMNEFVILIKDTSLITVLGLTADELDIFSFSRQFFSDSRNATIFIGTAIAYLVVTLPLIRLVTFVENRLHSGMTGMQL